MGIISNGDTVIDNGAISANEVDTTQINNDAVTADKIDANAVGASELNVSGNGTANQALISDTDGTFSWGDIVNSLTASTGITLDASVGDITISVANNSISADQLNVSGNGANGNVLISDGDGSFRWDDVSGGGGSTNVNLEIYRDNFTADGTDSSYTLSQSISDENDIQVYFDGVYQSKDNFSVLFHLYDKTL